MNLVERVKGIILTPKTEWSVIAGEPGDAAYLFRNYVAILAAIPAVCGFIGALLIGAPIFAALIGAVIKYLLTFVVVYIVAWIVDLLAPTFGSQKNFANALKLTVYSYTPSWLAGIFLLIPGLRFLTILGLYGLYLLWLGLPPLMKTPPEKTIVYTIAIVVCAIILAILIGLVLGALIGLHGFM
jgi:Yip1 domain